MDTTVAIDEATRRLADAARTGTPCPPVRELLPDDVDAAYRVQSALIAAREAAGAVRVGRKIGLTSPAVQAQLGVDQPDFGVLLDDMQVEPGGVAPYRRLLQPKVEGEVAFRLGRDLDGDLTPAAVRAAVTSAHAAIEIVDSRVVNWDIGIVDTVADNASSGLFVVAEEAVSLEDVEPVDVTMELELNGAVVSTGSGAACLGDPLNALLWLARAAARFGSPLRAGDLVLSGALGPMAPVRPGDVAALRIPGLGSVAVRFSEEER